jgi:co-chaperonin GroES (HSP10)
LELALPDYYSGDEIEVADKKYLIISRSDILAIIR